MHTWWPLVAGLLLLILASHSNAQSGSWKSVAYVDGGVCEEWGGAEGTPCEGTHYFSSFQEQGGALDLEFVDFSPRGSCQTTAVSFRLLGAFGGDVDHASYFLALALNDQFVASLPLNPSSFTSDSCALLEEIPVEAVAVNGTTYHSSGVNSLTVTPSELEFAAARFCAVEVTGQYLCTTPSCVLCDDEGDCHVSDRPGCCTSDEECAEDLGGSLSETCLRPHCDGPTNQCMTVWICTDPSVAALQPCTAAQDCDDVSSYCADVQCEETCVTEAILPIQPGCCNVASDCTPAVCAVAACDYVRHVCVYKPLSGCATPTASPSISKSGTPSVSPTRTGTPSTSTTPSPTSSLSPSTTATMTATMSPSPTATPTFTPTTTPSPAPSVDPPSYESSNQSLSMETSNASYTVSSGIEGSSTGGHWFWIIMGIILVVGLVTLAGFAFAGYGFYRYRRRATFIYPEDYIEDEEFPM